MSKIVCHTQKFKAVDVKGMQIHNQRESENSKNEDIDPSRTELNYDLANENHINFTERVKEIMEFGYKGEHAPKSNAVQLTGVLVSAEKDFFDKLNPEQQRLYFQTATDLLTEKFGKQNIVTATVHMDEKTPHLHFQFVPLTQDGRLCNKELTDRKNLLDIQERLPKALQKAGFDIQRGDPARGANKHIDTNKWKLQEASRMAQETANLEADTEARSKALQTREEALKAKETELASMEQTIAAEMAATELRLAAAKPPGELLKIIGRSVKQEPLFGKNHIDVLFPDFDKLWDMASVAAKAVESVAPLKAEAAKVPGLVKEVNSFKNQNANLTNKVKNLDKDLINLNGNLAKSNNAIYKIYQDKGLDDKQTACMMLHVDGIDKSQIASTIAGSSPAAPAMSDDARNWAKGILASLLNTDSTAVALIAKSAGRDISCLQGESLRQAIKEIMAENGGNDR